MSVNADFGIKISYDKGSKNPARVFRAMTDLIETLQQVDKTLVSTVDNKIEPIMLLEDIETSSLIAWIRNKLELVDDDALKSLDWKKQVGKYLVKGKYVLIDFLNKRSQITDKKELYKLSEDINKLAEETDVRKFPAYAPVNTQKLVRGIEALNVSLSGLDKADKVEFLSSEGNTGFNLDFNFVPEQIEEMLTKQSLSNEQEMILKVKKPDYLGDSKWQFKHSRMVEAKILHEEWLEGFQKRKIDIRPGDSLKAKVRVTVKYGYDNEVVAEVYEIVEVLKILVNESGEQLSIDAE